MLSFNHAVKNFMDSVETKDWERFKTFFDESEFEHFYALLPQSAEYRTVKDFLDLQKTAFMPNNTIIKQQLIRTFISGDAEEMGLACLIVTVSESEKLVRRTYVSLLFHHRSLRGWKIRHIQNSTIG